MNDGYRKIGGLLNGGQAVSVNCAENRSSLGQGAVVEGLGPAAAGVWGLPILCAERGEQKEAGGYTGNLLTIPHKPKTSSIPNTRASRSTESKQGFKERSFIMKKVSG